MNNTIFVRSYPRSGTHYFRSLLETNFGPTWSLQPEGSGQGDSHQLPRKTLDPGKYFYIRRNFDDVALSFLAWDKNNMGLEYFKSTPWKTIFETGAMRDSARRKEWLPDEIRHMTPYTFWRHHVDSWIHTPDVFVVTYEDLREEFQTTMLGVAGRLKSDKAVFDNILTKEDKAPSRPGGFRAVPK